MPYKEKPIGRRYVTITKLCRELRIATSMLRFYEDAGIIKPDKKKPVRRYRAGNAERIALVIRYGRTKIFTLAGLKFIYKHGRPPAEADLLPQFKNSQS